MKSYKRLTEEIRHQISAYLKVGFIQSEISLFVGVHKTTISREIRRNSGLRDYRPKQAQIKPRSRIDQNTWILVERILREDWSAEQVSERLIGSGLESVSPEWICQHIINGKIKGGSLHTYLRCQKNDGRDMVFIHDEAKYLIKYP